MDTRSKILSAAEAQSLSNGKPLTIVRGTFDPLLASHAADLTAAAKPDRKLVVIVDPGADPILPVQARAELVAGVGVVDYVIPLESAEHALPPAGVDLTIEHERRLLDLIAHVRRRVL